MAEEAILLASEPRDVREYLVKRASKPSFWDPISKETEAELLSKGDRLIDLSLAEYCLHRETASVLFMRNQSDWPIRSMILSNQALSKGDIFQSFPECVFGSEEALLAYLRSISNDERAVLFNNPSLDDGFLVAFLSLGKPWETMDSQQRLWALDNLAANVKLQRRRSSADFDDGWDWYSAGKPFEAAWSLIEKLDPGEDTAQHLGALLRNLPSGSYQTEGIADALKAWRTGKGEADKEAKENAEGKLSDFQNVRQAGARLLVSMNAGEPISYLNSDDIAYRCGAYEASGDLSTELVEAAVKRDGDLARVHLIRNARLWRKEETRYILLDVVLSEAETEEPRWEFQRRDRHYRKEFPAWFKDEAYSEPDDRLISELSIADVVGALVADLNIKSLQDRLSSIEKTQLNFMWMVGVTLFVLIVHIWSYRPSS